LNSYHFKEKIVKRKSIPLFLVVVLALTQTPLVQAQQSASAQQPRSTSDWAAVKELKVDERLVVKLKNGKEIKARMIEATDKTMVMDRDGKPLEISRDDVHQVYVIEGKAAKGKWALIGAGIGAGAGVGIGATKYSPDRDDSGIWPTMGLLIGTGAGAAAGFLFGQTKRHRVMVFEAL
jgi:hypothetical protein